MPPSMQLFLAGLIVTALLAALVLDGSRPLVVKLGVLVLFVLWLPALWFGAGELLGRPKPVRLEWWRQNVAEAEVLASRLREGEGIWLWLALPDTVEPRAYRLPWDRGLAEALLEARRRAEAAGTGVAVRLPFQPSLDDREPMFYPLPQPALPPKELLLPPPPAVPEEPA